MKLTIKRGMSLEKALMHVGKFLRENYAEFNLLNGDMNVYVTLKDDENRVCPDNENEYVIGADNTMDITAMKILEAKKRVLNCWNEYVKREKKMLEKKHKEIQADETYLAAAVELGRKPENIAKREKAYQKNQEELKDLLEKNQMIELFTERLKQGDFDWYISKQKGYRKSSYDYKLNVYLIFITDNGAVWHYGEKSYFDGRWGVLVKGMPDKY